MSHLRSIREQQHRIRTHCWQRCVGSEARCARVQNAMTLDVVGHLRSISSQQSRIRGLRSKLGILREATAKQDTAVAHLLFVRRVPAVYRQCLAECMRR